MLIQESLIAGISNIYGLEIKTNFPECLFLPCQGWCCHVSLDSNGHGDATTVDAAEGLVQRNVVPGCFNVQHFSVRCQHFPPSSKELTTYLKSSPMPPYSTGLLTPSRPASPSFLNTWTVLAFDDRVLLKVHLCCWVHPLLLPLGDKWVDVLNRVD